MKARAIPLLGLLGVAAVSQADFISYDTTIATKTTNWSDSMVLPKFDPSLGTLTGIGFYLEGSVSGTARGESLDAEETDIDLVLASTIKLIDPSNRQLAVVIPTVDKTFHATAYDGTTDYAGTSGVTFANQHGSDSITMDPTINSNLVATFVGSGNVTLGISAKGASNGSGAGNLQTQFMTKAGSYSKVTYFYTPTVNAVPEPASLAALGLGVMGLVRRRRKSA